MTGVAPISGYLVAPDYATRVVGPAYDALTPAERRVIADAGAFSFLRITRSSTDLPEGVDPAAARRHSSELLRTWIDQGVFTPAEPGFYLYRLTSGDHAQTGLVADVEVTDYQRGWVRRHEETRPEKEAELVAFLHEVGVNSSPVCLTYPAVPAIDRTVAEVMADLPQLDFSTDDGVRHTVWRVEGAREAWLIEAFRNVAAVYLTDGHHRAAAAARAAASGSQEAGRFLAVLFPADQLRILPYNRCVQTRRTDLLEVIGAAFHTREAAGYQEARPAEPGEFAMYHEGRWWHLSRRILPSVGASPVSHLDVSILHREILAPLLDTDTPDTDPRVSYVPGVGGPEALEHRCRSEQAVGFVLRPAGVEEMIAVADAGEVMPPKSTWFDPKARSGIFLVYR